MKDKVNDYSNQFFTKEYSHVLYYLRTYITFKVKAFCIK